MTTTSVTRLARPVIPTASTSVPAVRESIPLHDCQTSVPKVTALILTHLRTTFLLRAIESVVRQHGAGPAEIVLVSSVEKIEGVAELEDEAENRGIGFKFVQVKPGPVGPALVAGLSASTGDVIAFLDDDDEWETSRIFTLERAFDAVPGLVYFHNGQTLIDEFGSALPPWNLHRLIRHPATRLKPGRVALVQPPDCVGLGPALSMEPMFNNSSIAIRSSVLKNRTALLAQLLGGEDSFLFYCALAGSDPLMFSTDRLTRMRIHRNAPTAATSRDPRYPERLAALRAYASAQLLRIELCARLFPNPEVARRNPVLARDMARWSIIDATLSGARGRLSLHESITRVLTADYQSPTIPELLAGLTGIAAEFSVPIARAAFSAWRMAW